MNRELILKGIRIGRAHVETLLLNSKGPQIELMEAWAALYTLAKAGNPIVRLPRENAPAMHPDLQLATAPLRYEAACFYTDDWYLTLARIPAKTRLLVGGNRYFAGPPFPILAWLLSENNKHEGCGEIELNLCPTTKDLKLTEGSLIFPDFTTKKLRGAEFADYALRIVQCLGWFYSANLTAS